jgi:N-methylhydantoinase A
VRSADLRYFGQAYEVRVDVPDGTVTPELADTVAGTFHDAHRRLYGYDFRDDPRQEVEWVNVRVTGIGPIRKPSHPVVAAGRGTASAQTGTRRVHFEQWEDAGIHDRTRLGSGDVVNGPAVLEEFGSTIPVHPGFSAAVDGHGNVLISRDTAAEPHQEAS